MKRRVVNVKGEDMLHKKIRSEKNLEKKNLVEREKSGEATHQIERARAARREVADHHILRNAAAERETR